MPSDIYFCISQGVISTQVINPLLQGELIEVPPLVDSIEYRQILDDLIYIRSRTLALLIYPLHYEFISKAVKTLRWFDDVSKARNLVIFFLIIIFEQNFYLGVDLWSFLNVDYYYIVHLIFHLSFTFFYSVRFFSL